jgi:hypothetical protein
VKEVTEAYCGLSNQELQTKIYKESKDQLYITKNTLLLEINEKNINGEDREWFRQTLRNFIKYSPREAFDIVNDFANTSLLVDWKIMGSIFKEVWDYVALIRNKETPNRAFPELSEARINEHIERIEEIVRQHLKEAMEHVHIKRTSRKPSTSGAINLITSRRELRKSESSFTRTFLRTRSVQTSSRMLVFELFWRHNLNQIRPFFKMTYVPRHKTLSASLQR